MEANWVKENTATTGTGTITLGGADAGYTTFGSQFADGARVKYVIQDGDDREIGIGTYTAAGTTLSRGLVLETLVSGVYDNTAPVAITLSGTAIVSCTPTSPNLVQDGSDNVLGGANAGISISTGAGNLIVGSGAGNKIAAGSGNVILGKNAGPATNQSNKLFIDQAETDTPLIGGDFAARTIDIDGVLGAEGIAFPATQVPSADPNNLDDHEEGDWDIVLSDGTNDATSNIAVGTYVKTGKKVHLKGRLRTSSLGSVTGALNLTGIPFISSADAHSFGNLLCTWAVNLNITAGINIVGTINPNTSRILLHTWSATRGIDELTASEWTEDGDTIFNATYYV